MAQNKPQSFGVGRTINITNDAVTNDHNRNPSDYLSKEYTDESNNSVL